MAYGRKVEFEAVREAAFGDVGAAYAALGAALSDHARLISFYNTTNVDIYISFDGVVDHIRVASGSFQVFDLTANKVRDDGFFLANNTTISQRRVGAAPTSGALWAEVIIGAGGV